MRDRREWKLNEVDPSDRDVWRSNVRSAMRAAVQLPGWEPLMWVMLLYLHVVLNVDADYGDDSRAANSAVDGRILLNFKLIRDFMVFLVT